MAKEALVHLGVCCFSGDQLLQGRGLGLLEDRATSRVGKGSEPPGGAACPGGPGAQRLFSYVAAEISGEGYCRFPEFLWSPTEDGARRRWLTETLFMDESDLWERQKEVSSPRCDGFSMRAWPGGPGRHHYGCLLCPL